MPETPTRNSFSRRSVLAFGMASAAGLALTACTGGGAVVSESLLRGGAVRLPTYRKARAAIGANRLTSAVEGLPDIYTSSPTRYFTSVDAPPAAGSTVRTLQMLWFSPPAPEGQNPVWRRLNRDLHATFDPLLASADNYNSKLATILAGGKLPDLMFVQDQVPVGAQAFTAGAFADLSQYLSGDKILDYPNLANIPTYAWKAALKNGRIAGIPHVNPAVTSAPTIRTDLMQLVGFSQQPTSTAELLDMFTAIGKIGSHQGKRVWGIGGLGTGQIQTLARWMFGVGADWRIDSRGKLTYFLETDEFEEAVGYLRQLWQRGAFHPDALALGTDVQRSKEKQLWTEGHFAFEHDSPPWLAQQGMEQVEEGTKGAVVDFLVPPVAPGHSLAVAQDPGYWGIVAIAAAAEKDPRRMRELLGVCNYFAAPYGSSEALFLGSGIEGYNFRFGAGHAVEPIDNADATTNLQGLRWLGANAPSYIALDAKNAKRKDSLLHELELLTTAAKVDPTVGMYSPTQVSTSAQLTALNEDWRNKVVSGRAPLSAIATWRKQWRANGGDQVRHEFEKAIRNAK